MSRDFTDVLRLLYDEFGDAGVEFARTKGVDFLRDQVAARLGAADPHGTQSPAANAAPTDRVLPGARGNPADGGAGTGTEESDDDGEEQPADEGPAGDGRVGYADSEGFASTAQNRMDHVLNFIQSPADVVSVVENLVLMAGEVRKFEEAQVTRRMGIAAERDVAIANVKAQTEILQDYLARSFDERAENFSRLFDMVDSALDTNNVQALALGLDSVVKLAASSPFKDLRSVEETTAALTDPDHDWDF
jgi:hypothetical protein